MIRSRSGRSSWLATRAIGLVVATAVLATSTLSAAPAPAACRADSGAARAVLVELYTSEGCSSCPPADQELGRLSRGGAPVIPLALHVDYWDSIGWKDRFADPAFGGRQQWEVAANGRRTAFTPHFFVDGREVLDWRHDLAARLQTANAAEAQLTVAADPEGSARWHLKVDGRVAAAGSRAHGPLQLFVALTEGGLSSQVDAGENRGVLLQHEAVTRRLLGPIAVRDGIVAFDRIVDLPRDDHRPVSVVAFVQDATSAEVLQAVATRPCRGS